MLTYIVKDLSKRTAQAKKMRAVTSLQIEHFIKIEKKITGLFIIFIIFSIYSLCTKDNSPLMFRTCVMPKDCQTSEWSSWSSCSKTCQSTDLSPGFRLRSRFMTHIPAAGGKQCPAFEEKEACNIIGDLLPDCPR